jgi:hypothetical protein
MHGSYSSSVSGTEINLALYKSTVKIAESEVFSEIPTLDTYYTIGTSVIVQLATNDVIDIRGSADAASDIYAKTINVTITKQ